MSVPDEGYSRNAFLLENPEEKIENGQYSDTGNIAHIMHRTKTKVRFLSTSLRNQSKTYPSPWWAGDNGLNVWLTEEGPSYGINSSTALWITWDSERLREITLKKNPGRGHLWAGWMYSSMGRTTQKENPIQQCVDLA